MPTLSYDLHVHPAPSAVPRWGDGARVWQAAADAGVLGFVWKAHEEHTAVRCRALPAEPVRAIGSASLNPWARVADIVGAIGEGASWVWGPTLKTQGEIGWDLPLPPFWDELSIWLSDRQSPLVLATGHLGGEGRADFARLCAGSDALICSITHSLYVPLDEALSLAASGCAIEVDAFTYAFPPEGLERRDVRRHVHTLLDAGALVYFTSDGGQASTGNPFDFGARVLDELAAVVGHDAAGVIGVDHPAALVARLEHPVYVP
jgi:Family of unknown function (DUF6282)